MAKFSTYKNKKAQFILSELIFQIGQILILIILLVGLLYLITELGSTRILEKHKITRETALVIDSLYASPDAITYTLDYDLSKEKLRINIEPYKVVVKDVS